VRHSVQNAAKPRSSLLVHTCGHEVIGLKTYRGPKRKAQFGVCSLPGYYVPEAAVKQGRLILKVAIFASLDGRQNDTPREPASLGRVYSGYKKATRPEPSQAMEHLRYPNESTEYRAARNALLNDGV
jgi:hypothetical protein